MTTSTARSLRREEMDSRFQWRPEHIFPDVESWEQAFLRLESSVETLAECRGTLGESPSSLLRVLRLHDEVSEASYRVWWYPSLLHDQDTRDNEMAGRRQRVSGLFARAQTASSWLAPEIVAVGAETLAMWLDENEDLGLYRFALEDILRQSEHILDESQEKLLSFAAPVGDAVRESYGMLANADIRFPEIELSDGEKVQLTYQRYYTLLSTRREQADRRAAFEGLYDAFAASGNTFASLYNTICQNDWFAAQARGFDDTLQASLFDKAIPTQVYDTLLQTTFEHPEPLRRYFRLRKRRLGLESIQLYDGTVPLVELDLRYPYEEAMRLVADSVSPLGSDYQARVREGLDGGWVDVYESDGKRSGAYSAPVYGVHPYMLMNYNDTLGDLFTLAHEMGHSMHTVLSHESQPFVYAHYTIFVAEVGSTLNEALLLEDLLARSEDAQERALLLQHEIDSIAATFYTQVIYARFEREAHRLCETGQPITAQTLDQLYMQLLVEMYGDSVDFDERYGRSWSRIPHFFRSPYYVYQYATCFASAARLMEGMREDRESTVERYLTLLRSGGSAHPMDQLRAAGVDLSEPVTIRAVIERMDSLVSRLETELESI